MKKLYMCCHAADVYSACLPHQAEMSPAATALYNNYSNRPYFCEYLHNLATVKSWPSLCITVTGQWSTAMYLSFIKNLFSIF